MAGPVAIETFTSRTEAEIAREVLEANGIDSEIASDDLGNMIPAFQPDHGVALLVAEEDIDRARTALAEARSSEITDADALAAADTMDDEPSPST